MMDLKEFRANAHRLADWMADYLETLEGRRVSPEVQPGDVRRALPSTAPERAEGFDRVMADFERIVLPGMTHWDHPAFFAYFPGDHSPASILAEMLTAAMGAQCMSWNTSPAATETEQAMMEWLRQMVGLPHTFTGVLQDTASSATLVAMLEARERATGFRFAKEGAAAPGADKLVVYASREAHSSIDKAVRLAGLGEGRLWKIPTDASFAMKVDELAEAMAADRAAGMTPCAVVATVGTTSSTGIDDVAAIAKLCRQHGAWLHVDAAYAGSAAILPELRPHFRGWEEADSIVFNPHKWLFAQFDCSAYFVKDPGHLIATCGADPEYLKWSADDQVANFRDWGIPLGRRFRALKLWFVIRDFGVEGLRAVLREHLRLAQLVRQLVIETPGWEVLAPSPFGLVCFRYRPAGMAADDPKVDELNRQLLARVNATGKALLTHTTLKGRYAIRWSIGSLQVEERHVQATWELLRGMAG
ncbi:MAG TPA: aminotransferase class V-fold PLP-dependent enzyme [Gemmatimonadales bacterium]|nr:aminotransferase class V-fold PLP-dependent enzyme [Gemmatimonadales bacterium]